MKNLPARPLVLKEIRKQIKSSASILVKAKAPFKRVFIKERKFFSNGLDSGVDYRAYNKI